MITTAPSLLNSSARAWEGWNERGYAARNAILGGWAELLEPALREMVHFQCRQALDHLADTRQLPGPTGETNELYCSGRGVVLVGADERAPSTAVAGQIAAALITGNTVILCLPDGAPMSGDEIAMQLRRAGCPVGVVNAADRILIPSLLIAESVAGIAWAGSLQTAQMLSRRLAARSGPIAQLICETDAGLLPVIGSPDYVLRFVSERTRTINITAVGGNATLLELGAGAR